MREYIFEMLDAWGDDFTYSVEAASEAEARVIASKQCDDALVGGLLHERYIEHAPPISATHFMPGPNKREFFKKDADGFWHWWTDGQWKRQLHDKQYSGRHYGEVLNVIPL